ncbi:MAG TPA: substrate-binding domain-containing protein [Terriglobia bacterium]|nr:substrate-binding domain-containing protein [Terriglobia bacterium]
MKRDPYFIKSVFHSTVLMSAFTSPGEILSQRDLVQRTGLSRGIVHRILYTLEKSGIVEKPRSNQYRLLIHKSRHNKWKIGYGMPGIDSMFVREVTQSLQAAVERSDELELLILDHRYNSKNIIKNTDHFIRERVALVIEYQVDERLADFVADRYHEANIPVITVNNPYPHATYFGANNYRAGLIGGRHLGRWASSHWDGQIEEIIMVELGHAGSIPKSRLIGMERGIREVLGSRVEKVPVTYLDGDGQFEPSWAAMRKHLRKSRAERMLIGTMNDGSALGVLRAIEEAGRLEGCAIMGQNGSPEGRRELRRPNTRLIGSVAYFPETYGDGLVRLALDILNRRFVPPAVFTRHLLLTRDNVDRLYPNDSLMKFPILTA